MNRKEALDAFARAGRMTDDEYQRIERERLVTMGKMTDNGRAWKGDHPQSKPEINFIAPVVRGKPLALVGTVEDAVAMGYIKCNPEGLELVKALYPWDQPDSPTYTMVKEVVERLYAHA